MVSNKNFSLSIKLKEVVPQSRVNNKSILPIYLAPGGGSAIHLKKID